MFSMGFLYLNNFLSLSLVHYIFDIYQPLKIRHKYLSTEKDTETTLYQKNTTNTSQ